MDKRIIAVLSTLIFVIAFLPVFEPMDASTNSQMTAQPVSTPTVSAAYKYRYVASIHSHVYHKITCRYEKKIKRCNRIYFKTKAQARAHGYRPCKICRP